MTGRGSKRAVPRLWHCWTPTESVVCFTAYGALGRRPFFLPGIFALVVLIFSRVNPLLHLIGGGHTHIGDWAQAVVGAGLPAKGPGLLANIPGRSPLPWPPYSRVNPLLHLIGGGHTHIGDWAQAVVGAGLPAKWPVQVNKKSPHQTMRAFSSLIPGFRPPWLPAGSASGSAR